MLNVKISGIKKLLSFGITFFSINTYSMLCPSNFNNIEMGYTIGQVLQLCGNPSERAEEKITISNTEDANNKVEKVIVITRFIYAFPQHAALFFEDGILSERILLTK